jgi:hypothetical protein
VRISGVRGWHSFATAIDDGPTLTTLITEGNVVAEDQAEYRRIYERLSAGQPWARLQK